MSFILDALRKAESSRHAPAPPDTSLGEIAPAATPGRRGPMLALIVFCVLFATAAVVWWSGRGPQAKLATVPPPQSQAGLPEALPQSPSQRELRPLYREVRRAERDNAAQAPMDAAGMRATRTAVAPTRGGTVTVADQPLTSEASAPPARADTARTPAPDTATRVPEVQRVPGARETLPGYQDLVLSGRAKLPPLHLDIHVFADDPARRFVFVNNRKYREGERLDEGGRVEKITPHGAILEHRGHRFELLPD